MSMDAMETEISKIIKTENNQDNQNDLLNHPNPEEVTDLNLDNKGPLKLTSIQGYISLVNLSLKNVGLTSLKGFPKLHNLKKLDLSSNNLTSTLFFLNGCHQLSDLNLSNNSIKEVFPLKPLGKLKQLQSLKLVNCEVTKVIDYRKKVFRISKMLKNLDGEDKTEEDAKPPQPEDPKIKKEDDPTNGTKKGKKRKSKEVDLMSKRQKTEVCSKNPLMQLNELKPGLKYSVEKISGPAHSPHFIVSVEVHETKFMGKGNSKQLAKHAAARAALLSFVQFRNTPLALTAIKPIGMMDFTSDVKNEEFDNEEFECHKNGSNLSKKMDTSTGSEAKSMKILMEAEKKNPVMLLNEMHPGLEYKMEAENNSAPSQRFRVTVKVEGMTYEGTGPNKKLAKVAAARSVLSNLYNVSYNSYATNIVQPDSQYADLFTFPSAVADKISTTLMNTYNDVMIGNTESAKWKVIAGIAMTRDEAMQDIQIVSISTGTKCINGEHISMVGASLNDCHAEIVSRRCLKDFLYTNLELHLEGEEEQSIFIRKPGGGFCLKPNIKFHLYISTAPCGDARIFCPHEELMLESIDRHPNRNSRGVLRTKIESGEGTIPIKPGQGVQTWDGILPGQERLLTMSCSDKVSSWNVLGMQGALLSFFVDPIYLDSIILGGLFHPNHLPRAMFARFERSLPPLPSQFRLNKPKLCTISSPETRHLAKSPNLSVNWTHGLGRAEVVNATTGKTEKGQVSRLSKRAFFQRFMNIYDRLPHIDRFDTPHPALYATYKGVVKDYQMAKKGLITAFRDAGLGTWVKKPVEQNEFELVF